MQHPQVILFLVLQNRPIGSVNIYVSKLKTAHNNLWIAIKSAFLILCVFNIATSLVYYTPFFNSLYIERYLDVPAFFTIIPIFLTQVNSSIYNFLFSFSPEYYKFLVLLIGAPILEEFEFRYLVYRASKTNSKTYKILISLISTIIFMACHPVPVGFMLCIGSLALISCHLICKTQRLWPSIVLHMTYNLIVISFPVF